MPQVTKILRPAELIPGIAAAVEKATLESLGVKNHAPKLDQKRIDRAQRVVEILVADGILGVEPEQSEGQPRTVVSVQTTSFADDNDREQFEQTQGRSQ